MAAWCVLLMRGYPCRDRLLWKPGGGVEIRLANCENSKRVTNAVRLQFIRVHALAKSPSGTIAESQLQTLTENLTDLDSFQSDINFSKSKAE